MKYSSGVSDDGSFVSGSSVVVVSGNSPVDASSPDAAIVVDHHGELLAALGLA